jgi:hypothetical protein
VFFDEFAHGVSGSVLEFPTFSRATRGRDPLPMPSRSLEVRKKKVKNQFNEHLPGNVSPMTARDSDIILHMHCVYLNCPVL